MQVPAPPASPCAESASVRKPTAYTPGPRSAVQQKCATPGPRFLVSARFLRFSLPVTHREAFPNACRNEEGIPREPPHPHHQATLDTYARRA